MANSQVATDFEKIINADRDRKKNEALAAKVFNKRASGGGANTRLGGGSLASRVGIKKRAPPTGPRASLQHAASLGDINGEWTHDLHDRHSAPSTPRASPRPASLASRISNPNARSASRSQPQRRAAQVAQALMRSDQHQPAARPAAAPAAAGGGGFNKGITIRGLAGPFVVMAQNFAPGTTAADIESAMTPIGGIVSSCRLLKSTPIVIAELVFESKEGADNVVSTFNNQTADGRVLNVYHKQGAVAAAAPASGGRPPTGPRAERQHDTVVDGTLGFDDPMDERPDSGGGSSSYTNGDRGRGQGGLYSDSIVRSDRGRSGGGGRWSQR